VIDLLVLVLFLFLMVRTYQSWVTSEIVIVFFLALTVSSLFGQAEFLPYPRWV
jgi:hypothetical protein